MIFGSFKAIAALVLLSVLVACPSSPPDTTAPSILSSIPASGSSNVSSRTSVTLVFSEAMNQTSLQVTSSPTVEFGLPTWGSDSSTVTLSVPKGFKEGQTYGLTVVGSDTAGNQIGGTKIINFNTVAPLDTTPPAIPSGLSLSTNDGQITLNWTANTETDLVGYNLVWGTTAAALDNQQFIAKTINTQTITGLLNDTPYFFALDAQDQNGNRSSRTTPQTATPRPPVDIIAPTLTSSIPTDGTADIVLLTTLRLEFSEAIDQTSLNLSSCIRPNLTDPPVDACFSTGNIPATKLGTPTWNNNDRNVTLTPDANLFMPGTIYQLNIAAKDKAGNAIVAPKTIRFSIKVQPDTAPPTLVTFTPTNNQFAVPYNSPITLSFSEPMNQSSVESAFLAQPSIKCVWTWTSPSNASCQPSGRLEQRGLYTIAIAITATDLAGNQLQTAYGFSFTAGDAPPKVISYSPKGFGALPPVVLTNTPITVTFSEDMNKPLTEAAFQVRENGFLKTGTITWNTKCAFFAGAGPTGAYLNCKTLTFTPSTNYQTGSGISWTISTGATDYLNDQQMENNFASSFTTQGVLTP